MLTIFSASLLIGAFAGLSAGLFGIGGGVLVVPFLGWLFAANQFESKHVMLMAVATSLATALLTSAASARAHYLLGNIVWHRVLSLTPGLLLGAVIGAALAEFSSASVLRNLFIAYLFYSSIHMALPKKTTLDRKKMPKVMDYPVGLMIGVISAMLGIGGGTMTVPYLTINGLDMKNAVATSSTCALPIALSAAVSYILLGWTDSSLPNGSLGYIYLPAFFGIVFTSMLTASVGAKLANKLPAAQLKRYFALVLLLIALKMAG